MGAVVVYTSAWVIPLDSFSRYGHTKQKKKIVQKAAHSAARSVYALTPFPALAHSEVHVV